MSTLMMEMWLRYVAWSGCHHWTVECTPVVLQFYSPTVSVCIVPWEIVAQKLDRETTVSNRGIHFWCIRETRPIHYSSNLSPVCTFKVLTPAT
jgi:hypothetical protein